MSRESVLPPSWQTSRAGGAWWARVAEAPHSVLVLDYDGTLAPFHLDRMSALPYPGVEDRLSLLLCLERVTLVLVTGRSFREIKALFPFAGQMEVWASHGWEHRLAGGAYHFFPLTDEQRTLLGEVAADLEAAHLPAFALERKPASIAIHWRGLEPDEQEMVRQRVLKRFDRLEHGDALELLPFEDGVELRAAGRTKGDAMREVRARYGPDVPIAYLGDDRTDEDAFAVLHDDDIGLLVRPAPRATLANYWAAPPEGVLDFLDGWIEAAGELGKPVESAGAAEAVNEPLTEAAG